jgi:proteasome lid subunit RPN8/RPN11
MADKKCTGDHQGHLCVLASKELFEKIKLIADTTGFWDQTKAKEVATQIIGGGQRIHDLELLEKKPVKNHPEAFSILKEAVSGQDWLREDKETAELFAAEPEYLLERSAANEIIARAKEAYPNEFGAMLRGINRITHIEPVMESAEGKAAYMFSMFNRFSQRMVEGEGVVHSHPSGAAYPSGADIAMFHQFPGINIIIGYPYTDGSMAAYDRLGNRVTLRIVPDGG